MRESRDVHVSKEIPQEVQSKKDFPHAVTTNLGPSFLKINKNRFPAFNIVLKHF